MTGPPSRRLPQQGGIEDGQEEGHIEGYGAIGTVGAQYGPCDGGHGQHGCPPASEEEGTVGEPHPAQKGKGDGYPYGLTGVDVEYALPGDLVDYKLEKGTGQGQKKDGQGQTPAVFGPVEPVQVPAHRLRVPHLGHRPVQGGGLLQTISPVVGGLVGDVVGELPQQGCPGPPPPDLSAHGGEVIRQNFTRHRTRPLPAPHGHRRHRSATAPPVPQGLPGPPE